MAILGHLAPKIKRGCLQALPPVPTPLLTLSGVQQSCSWCPCPWQEGWNQTIFMVLSNPNRSTTSAHLCSSPSRSEQLLAEQTWLCPQRQPRAWGKEQEEQSRCSGSCGSVDVPVAVCELCVCVCQSLCVCI